MRWRGGWLIFLRIYFFIFLFFFNRIQDAARALPWQNDVMISGWHRAEMVSGWGGIRGIKVQEGFCQPGNGEKTRHNAFPVVFLAIRREKRGCFAYIDRIKNAKSVTKSLEICFSTSVFSFATLLFFNIYQRGISPQCSSLTPSVQHNELGIFYSF